MIGVIPIQMGVALSTVVMVVGVIKIQMVAVRIMVQTVVGVIKILTEAVRSMMLMAVGVTEMQTAVFHIMVQMVAGDIKMPMEVVHFTQNTVFIRGGGEDSSSESKTECVNGIRMLPQFIWLKGSAVVEELGLTADSI